MPSLEKLTRLSPRVLQKTLKLEPRQHYGPDEPDNLVFMSPSVALKDEELRHGGPSNSEIGAKECLSLVTRKILETKDVSLFEVPEITATHLGYGKKAGNKEGRRAITQEEGQHWLKMLDFRRFSHLPESEDTDITPEFVQEKLSGLKIEEQGRFHLFFSILLIYFEKNKNHEDERKATVGPNKISDFLIFWTLPYLLNFSHRKVQEILMHGKKKRGEDYFVKTVKICTEDLIESACDQMADLGEHLLTVFREVLGSKPLEEEYELLADKAELPIIFVPMEYQVTKMPVHITDLGSKATWNKLVDTDLLADFLKVFVDNSEIQRDFFHALSGLEGRQGIDYAIVLPDMQTYEDFVKVIKEKNRDAFIEQPRSIHCQGIHAERAVVKGSKTNFTVCFSYLQGSDNVSIAQLFRAIGSHYLNHFTVIILDGKICNSLDSYRRGDLHPVSKAMKFVKEHGRMVRVTKRKKEKRGTLVYPLQCVGGRGLFTEIDFPVTYLRWENEVKNDPVVHERGLVPQYRYDKPLSVGFFKKGISQIDESLPLKGPGLACTPEKLQAYTYRVVNLDGSVIALIARSARKHGHAMIMALSGYCGKFKCSISSRPEIMRTIICHFVRAIILAGLPSVYRTVPDSEDHEVEMGSESEEEEEEEEEQEEKEEEEDSDADQRDSGYHSGTTISQGSPVDRTPTDHDLLLVQSVGNKYEELGMYLGVPREVLQDIKDNTNLQTPGKKALEMLREWRNRDEDASCMKLADGLRIVNVGRGDLAKKLLKQL